MLLLLHYLIVALDCKSLGVTILPTLLSRYTSFPDPRLQAWRSVLGGSVSGRQVLQSGSTEGNLDEGRLWTGRLKSCASCK